MFHFKRDTIVAWRLLVQMKYTQINVCAPTGDYRLLFSLWNQRRALPKNLLLLLLSKRCMIVKCWLRKLKDVLVCTTVCWKNTVDKGLIERLGKSVRGSRLFLSAANWTAQRNRKASRVVLISLIQILKYTLICCKLQRCLTYQWKLTLAESCNYLVVVKTGKYFFGVCQIPNHTLSYCHGTAPCGDVTYLVKI